MKICTMFGHSSYQYELFEDRVKKIFSHLIQNHDVDTFYCGGRGDFDWFCMGIIKELKETFPHIKSYLILSYQNGREQRYSTFYDDTLYLLEKPVLPRFAIPKTNQLMVDKADFVVSGTTFTYGGAFKTMQYAEKKKKPIISIFHPPTI